MLTGRIEKNSPYSEFSLPRALSDLKLDDSAIATITNALFPSVKKTRIERQQNRVSFALYV